MKKKVKQYVQQTQTGGKNRDQVLKEFSRMLDDQVPLSLTPLHTHTPPSPPPPKKKHHHQNVHLQLHVDTLPTTFT